MEILITDRQDGCVQVCSTFGRFFGIWCSSSPPELKSYVVELDSDDVIVPKLLTFSPMMRPGIESQNNTTYLTGLVEDIEDNIIFLRIGADIVMLDTVSSFDFSRYIGHFVRVSLSTLYLYDIGLS